MWGLGKRPYGAAGVVLTGEFAIFDRAGINPHGCERSLVVFARAVHSGGEDVLRRSSVISCRFRKGCRASRSVGESGN